MKNLLTMFMLAILAVAARPDDYQCVSDTGCVALMPGPTGTREVKFKKGDIVSTSSGWIVNPAHGWRNVDFASTLMPHLNPDKYMITDICGTKINYVQVEIL